MKKVLKEVIPYIIIIAVIVLIRSFIITPVRVEGSSMKTTLSNGDILLLYKLGNVKQFDIVVLDELYDNEVIIKRIIGLPGDTVEINNGKIYVNDEVIEDEYAYGETSDCAKIKLADDEYFILGDNRLISKDSRYFGPVKEDEIIGKVIFRIFPFTKITSL